MFAFIIYFACFLIVWLRSVKFDFRQNIQQMQLHLLAKSALISIQGRSIQGSTGWIFEKELKSLILGKNARHISSLLRPTKSYVMTAVRASAFPAGQLSGVNSQQPCGGTGDRLWQPLPHCFSAATGSNSLHIVESSYNHIHMRAPQISSPHLSLPQVCSPLSPAPMPKGSAVLPACIAQSRPTTTASNSLLLPEAMTWCCSLHYPWASRSPEKFNKFEEQRFHFI